MSPKPRLSEHELAAILNAAARVVARRTPAHARLADIAREAQLSVGALQHYFGSRADLLAATYRHTQEVTLARYLEEVEAVSDPMAKLSALINGIASETFDEEWLPWVMFLPEAVTLESFSERARWHYTAWTEPIRTLIEQGTSEGKFEPALPVDSVITTFVGAAEGFGIQVLVGRIDAREMRALLGELAAVLLRIDTGGS